jgi:hypothetical protein
VDSSMDPSKSGGQFLKLHLQVIDGPHAGVTLFDRLNLINSNPKAVEIAQRTLSAICHAVGVLRPSNSEELHNRPMVARVAYLEGGTRPDGNGGFYGPSNELKGYKPVSQQAPVQAAQQQPAYQAPAPAAQAAPAGTPPWMTKAA